MNTAVKDYRDFVEKEGKNVPVTKEMALEMHKNDNRYVPTAIHANRRTRRADKQKSRFMSNSKGINLTVVPGGVTEAKEGRLVFAMPSKYVRRVQIISHRYKKVKDYAGNELTFAVALPKPVRIEHYRLKTQNLKPKTQMTSEQIRNTAYHSIIDKLPLKRKRVMQAIIQLGECTNKDIAKKLNCQINEITGRTSELQETFMIKKKGERELPSGFTHSVWVPIMDEEERQVAIQIAKNDTEAQIDMMTDDLERLIASKIVLCADSRNAITKAIQKKQHFLSKIKQLCN